MTLGTVTEIRGDMVFRVPILRINVGKKLIYLGKTLVTVIRANMSGSGLSAGKGGRGWVA